MQQLIIIIHVLVSISLIALVLIQHGKGADVGAAFGSGASNTMFGSAGSTPFLVKVTGLLAGIFFLTSLGLTYLVAARVKENPVIAPIHRSVSLPSGSVADDLKPAKNQPVSTSPEEKVPQTPN